LSQKDIAANYTAQSLATTVPADVLIDSTVTAIREYNAGWDAVRSIFAETTTDYQARYRGALTNMLQEGDEFQQPDPVKGASRYTVGFPIHQAMTKWGATYVAKHKMTLADFAAQTELMLNGDVNWNRYRMLGALLFSGTDGSGGAGTLPYTFSDPLYGDISVFGLANGDATTYAGSTADVGATDTHYSAQSAAISDSADPFDEIYEDLAEHSDNGTVFVSFIPPALATATRGLTAFTKLAAEIPGLDVGDNTTTFNGTFPGTLPPNAKLIGVHNEGLYIATWPSIPANHIVSVAMNGPRPLKYRQDPEASLQGFGPVDLAFGNFGNRFPYFEENWLRRGGYGANSRIAAHVHQVATGGTTYVMNATFSRLYGLS
jgi:hypothetical protein